MGQKVVVVGGGYAGTMIAKEFDGDAEVVLVDPRDAFVNASASLRASVRRAWARAPFFTFSTLLEHGQAVRAAVASADAHGVTLEGGDRIDADYVVLATGSSHSYPARPRAQDLDAGEAANHLRATSSEIAAATSVLILGAGPVGLELAGEIREAWPAKRITVVDRSARLLPGYLPEVREALVRQLAQLSIDLHLHTSLITMPPVRDGVRAPFAVATTSGETIRADIWFRAFGSRVNTAYLDDGALVRLTERHEVPVDAHLNVVGHRNVFAVGDIADTGDPKMATWAQTQAATVVENLRALLRGDAPTAEYARGAAARILLPLGTRHGVGQMPSPDGPSVLAPPEVVAARKGVDLFTSRFAERFNAAGATLADRRA